MTNFRHWVFKNWDLIRIIRVIRNYKLGLDFYLSDAKIQNNMIKIKHERNICIGCGACVSLCPKFWEMAEDGKATLKKASPNGVGSDELEVEKSDCNQEAADTCPVQCIVIVSKKII